MNSCHLLHQGYDKRGNAKLNKSEEKRHLLNGRVLCDIEKNKAKKSIVFGEKTTP